MVISNENIKVRSYVLRKQVRFVITYVTLKCNCVIKQKNIYGAREDEKAKKKRCGIDIAIFLPTRL